MRDGKFGDEWYESMSESCTKSVLFKTDSKCQSLRQGGTKIKRGPMHVSCITCSGGFVVSQLLHQLNVEIAAGQGGMVGIGKREMSRACDAMPNIKRSTKR